MAPRLSKATSERTKHKKQSSCSEQPLKETIKNKGLEVVKRIQKKDTLRFFTQPVDTSYVTDYLDVIKKPMDLGTVQEKLRTYSYASFEELWQDIELIWKNCCTYNSPHTQFYQSALKLQKFSKRVFSSLCMFLRKNGLEAEARALHTAMRRYYSPKSSLEVKHLESVDIAKDTFSLTKPQGDSESIARKTLIPNLQGQYANESTQSEKDFYARVESLANSYLNSAEDYSANNSRFVRKRLKQDLLRKEHVRHLPEPECVSQLPSSSTSPYELFSGKSSIGFEDYRSSLDNFTRGLHPRVQHFVEELLSSGHNNSLGNENITERNNVECSSTKSTDVSKNNHSSLEIIGDRMETLVAYLSDKKLIHDLVHFDASNIDFSMPYGVTLKELQQLFSLRTEFGVPLNFLSELIIGTKYFTDKFSLSPKETQTENVTGLNDSSELRDGVCRPHPSHLVSNTLSQFSSSREPVKVDESCPSDIETRKTSHEVQVRANKLEGGGSDVFCMNCGTVKSPGWRAGPPNARRLCNACGLFWAKHKQHRPKEKWFR